MQRLKINSPSNKKSCANIKKGFKFLLGKMYFTGGNRYQNFQVFASVPQLLARCQSVYHLRKIKLFDTKLEPSMSNLANGRVIFKINNSILKQKHFTHCIVT